MNHPLKDLHLNLYHYVKKKAYSYEGRHGAKLKKYLVDQKYYSNRDFKATSYHEMLSAISNSNITYIGDFHTFDQSSKNIQRLIKRMLNNKKKFVLALELVHYQKQHYIDYFLKGSITELEFLESINYKDSWRFPWTHYRPLFKLAKETGFPILALNSDGDLSSRDQFAAQVIMRQYFQDTQTPILVLFGELHILPNKLPKQTLVQFMNNKIHENSQLRQTIIHQNIDEVYWKTYDNKSQQTFSFNKNEFCLLTSPPWIKYESMIYWYENLIDDPEFDIHEYILETGMKTFIGDTTESFLNLCEQIIQALDINEGLEDSLQEFTLYDQEKMDFIYQEVQQIKPANLRRHFSYLIETNQYFKLASTTKLYCPNYSLNRLSCIAGIHLFSILLEKLGLDEKKIIGRGSNTERFLLFFYQHLVSYFSSKIINPYRKCNLYLDLVFLGKSEKTNKENQTYINTALKILEEEVTLSKSTEKLRLKSLYEASKILGHLYGELLFNKIQAKEIVIPNYKFFVDNLSLSEDCYMKFRELLLENKTFKMQRKRFF